MSNRANRWPRLIAELESSGLSRAEFCRRRKVNYHTLTYHLRQAREWNGASKGPSFVEVDLPSPVAVVYDVVLDNGRSVRVSGTFDEASLARLIRVVESC